MSNHHHPGSLPGPFRLVRFETVKFPTTEDGYPIPAHVRVREVRSYATLRAFVRDNFVARSGYFRSWTLDEIAEHLGGTPGAHEIRDAWGDPVPFKEIATAFEKAVAEVKAARGKRLDEKGRFRAGPWAGTGRFGHGTMFRRPRTTAEMRALQDLDGDAPAPRPSRTNLPSHWDDKIRRDYGCKNWKKFRRTQWKEQPAKA